TPRPLHHHPHPGAAGTSREPDARPDAHTLRHLASHKPYRPKMIKPRPAAIRRYLPNGWLRSVWSAASRPPALDALYWTAASITSAPASADTRPRATVPIVPSQ